MAKRISKVLVTGVVVSSLFILIGIALAVVNNDFAFSHSSYNMQLFITDLKAFKSIAFLMLGVFILILTPIIRVIGMMIQYYFEKNYKYVYISLIILVVLAISLMLGVTHN